MTCNIQVIKLEWSDISSWGQDEISGHPNFDKICLEGCSFEIVPSGCGLKILIIKLEWSDISSWGEDEISGHSTFMIGILKVNLLSASNL